MGYFLDINNDAKMRAKNTAQNNALNTQYNQYSQYGYSQNGQTLLGMTLAQGIPSIFMGILNNVEASSDGKGGSGKEASIDAQKKSLEKQLNKALSAIGVDDVNKIDVALNAQQTKLNNIQNNVNKFDNGQDEYSIDIKNLESQKISGANLTDEQIAQNKQIDKQIKAKKAEQQKAKEAAQKEYNNVLKTFQEMSVNADKANNLKIQLQNLKAVDDSSKVNTTYDIEQRSTDLSDFNKAMKNFLKNKNKQTAQALKDAYENVDSAYTQNAYKRLEKDVNAYLQ